MNHPIQKIYPATIDEGIELAERLAYDTDMLRHYCDLTDVAFNLSGALGCFEQINDKVLFIADPVSVKECLLDALNSLSALAEQLTGEMDA